MEKIKLEKFISKYNLGQSCESVLLTATDFKLSTRAISVDNNVLCEVVGPSLGMPDGEYPVYETQKLQSLLGVLGDSLKVSVKTSSKKPVGIEFSDSNTDVTFVLADKTVIPNVPDIKKLPPFDLHINFDKTLVSTFIKAKNALSDVDVFTVVSEGKDKTAQLILGYSANNTHRVKMTVNTTDTAKVDPINFSAKYLKEILVANKDADGGVLEVSSKGLSRISFDVDNITSTYYLVQISID